MLVFILSKRKKAKSRKETFGWQKFRHTWLTLWVLLSVIHKPRVLISEASKSNFASQLFNYQPPLELSLSEVANVRGPAHIKSWEKIERLKKSRILHVDNDKAQQRRDLIKLSLSKPAFMFTRTLSSLLHMPREEEGEGCRAKSIIYFRAKCVLRYRALWRKVELSNHLPRRLRTATTFIRSLLKANKK